MSFLWSKAALAAPLVAVLFLLAPQGFAMQVEPIAPVVWDTAAGGNGHTYLFVPLKHTVSWSEANALAESMTLPDGSTGYLATLTSSEEKAFVKDAVLPQNNWFNQKTAVWIGGENQFLLVGDGPGPKDWGSSKAKGWQQAWKSAVAPESWHYSKWQSENEPGDDGPIEKRFLTKWTHNHKNGYGAEGECSDGPPQVPQPKIIGMIVEWDAPEVPEPATALLSALGIALLGLRRRLR